MSHDADRISAATYGWASGGQFGRFESVLGIIYLIGFFSSALELRLLRATGKGTIAILLFSIQVLGLSFAACQNLLQLMGRADANSRLFQIADAAWPFSHIFLIVIGIAVLLARVWPGWRRFIPLLCGFALPLAMAAGAAGGLRLWALYSVFSQLHFSCFLVCNCHRP